jgi:thiosulfate/3-mercaptopyruvate sulfurtransferase
MIFDTVISARDLATNAGNANWRIFDCRHDLAKSEIGVLAYRVAHIPGAQFMHLDRDMSGVKSGRNGRHPLPDPATLSATLARRGISNDTQVIAYDDSGGAFAARLWWMMRWLGHTRVAVLDGGLPAWVRSGHALTGETPAVTAGTFDWTTNSDVVDSESIRNDLAQPRMLLIDARAPERYRGESETLDPVAGHIPGAVNRFYKDNLGADGCFKSSAQLHQEFSALLKPHSVESAVHYCGSGVTSCHNLLAMQIAGLRGARLYAGSWSEWCSDPQRPVVTGSTPKGDLHATR